MSRVVVTGGAGFLGSHLCEALLDRGDEVVCLDNFVTGTPENVAHLTPDPRFRLVRSDVTIEADDDYGILFRQNGNTERFDNTVNLGAGGSFPASPGGAARKVEIAYSLNSFADGATVRAVSTVDGIHMRDLVLNADTIIYETSISVLAALRPLTVLCITPRLADLACLLDGEVLIMATSYRTFT